MIIESFEQYLHEVFHTFEEGDNLTITARLSEERNLEEKLPPVEIFTERLALYRGHSNKEWDLIPSIARKEGGGEKKNSEVLIRESKIISEFKRRRNISQKPFRNDLDLLIYAQHFGLETRLLDWSTNPLVALFFACFDKSDEDGAVHLIFNKEEVKIPEDPLKTKEVLIFPPDLNNERVVAQNGWFTIHPYHNSGTQNRMFKSLSVFIIPSGIKNNLLKRLDSLGINYESVFPGVEGTCKYINWKTRIKSFL